MSVDDNILNVWSLKRSPSVKDQIIETILRRVSDGHLRIGSALPPESRMCHDLGVSRVVFREAVKQLEILGFLKIDRGNGTIVCLPGFQCLEPVIDFLGITGRINFNELHDLRTMVEVEAVRLTAEKGDDKLVRRLGKILEQSEKNLDKEFSYIDLDFKFHKEILNACPNRLIAMILTPFETYLRRSRRLSFQGVATLPKTIKAHRSIMDAIRNRNPAKAARLMSNHLASTAKELDKFLYGNMGSPQSLPQ